MEGRDQRLIKGRNDMSKEKEKSETGSADQANGKVEGDASQPQAASADQEKAKRGSDGDWEAKAQELRQQRDEFRELAQRKQAEFENYRKRTLRERDGIRHAARAEVLERILAVGDACEKGIESMPQGEDDSRLATYRQGYELLLKQIQDVFSYFGVESVQAQGQPFDPEVHEAVMREEASDQPDGTVLEEFRKGYTYRDRLLRPAQVKVSVGGGPNRSGSETASSDAAPEPSTAASPAADVYQEGVGPETESVESKVDVQA